MITLLLVSAVILGTLSFFEPCTIATHTLFTVRAHRQRGTRSDHSLFTLWMTRSSLTAGLLVLATWITDPPAWGPYTPSVILAAIATIYLVSRLVYIPVPHLAFHRLLPGGARLPQAVQLGLTLPACTLPLFVIVAGVAATVDSVAFAAMAGLLFAGSLPFL